MDRIYQSESIKELASALVKAQAEMDHATKSANNPFFKSKYADLPAVIDASRPSLAKNGLAVTQTTDYDEQGKLYLVTTLVHTSGEWLRGWYPISPVKNDPQGVGSAVTYARRYAYQAISGGASIGEDDDGNAASGKEAEEVRGKKAARTTVAGQPALLLSSDAKLKKAQEFEATCDTAKIGPAERGMIFTAAVEKDGGTDPSSTAEFWDKLIGKVKTDGENLKAWATRQLTKPKAA